ncbi:ABC transporter permease [Pseudooceanicola sp. CBS1P-1]|uniref:ABC transporter permease subunit n=1 Tax=Pseudooceanicola albus TaxID=2692189 RepID=A0A6L7G338_9RHOB|nr:MULTISPECIES: ABC transporter permease [Pseudooceanicola]MBT9385367.1 ABC transporter permease [Pseudooceanicola endophyticus]MXN18774.1 ABC transporter permease subunit [Pseudooceanicola albus]
MKQTLKTVPLSAWIGILGISLCVFAALFAPWISPYDPNQILGDPWAERSPEYLLGLDNLGRDLLSRLIWGTRMTLFVATVATVIAFSMGVILSLVAAVMRGVVDIGLSRLNDLLMSIPTLIFALIVLSALPQTLGVLIMVMAVLDATRVFRLGRALAMDLVAMEFVEAVRLRGEGTLWIVFKEVLPNAMTPLLAEFGLRLAFAVLFISTLSFLGLGIQPPTPDWGGMVKDNKDGIIFGVSAALVPGMAIAVLTVSINLVVDWLLKRTSSLKGGRGDG